MYYFAVPSYELSFPLPNESADLIPAHFNYLNMASTYPFIIEFSEADLNKINNALLTLEEAFSGKLITDNSSPANDYQIENVAAIPTDDGTLYTLALPAHSNINQWDKDEKARAQLSPIANRLKEIAQQVVNTNRAVLQRCWNSTGKYFE
ncbi:MAG: hypothetical protein JST81_01305 [Bacteroidetes bacterium]|nr:hypothetical protein [Bacteroidota bacterium]